MEFADVQFRSKVRSSYWNNKNNQRKFLHDFAEKYNVKTLQDWGNVTTQQVSHYFDIFNLFQDC